MKELFYWYAVVYALVQLHCLWRNIYLAISNNTRDFDIFNDTDRRLALKQIGWLQPLLIISNSVWVVAGLWRPEWLCFSLILVLSWLILYYRVTSNYKPGMWYAVTVLKLAIVFLIMFNHIKAIGT